MTLAIIDPLPTGVSPPRPLVVIENGRDTAESARQASIATLAVNSASAATRYFTSQAAGEAGSTTGQFFSHPDAAGGLVYRERTAGGSTIIAYAATKAQVDAKVATATLSASAGSAGIGSIRSETGATAMTIEARVRQQHALVGDFGIVGTQVGGVGQNDRTALIAALNCGATLLIPGAFTIRSTASITSADLFVPWNILGQVRETSKIFFDVNGKGIHTTNSNARGQLDNLTIYGNLANPNGAGLDLFDNSSRTLSRLEVYNFAQTGLQVTQTGGAVFNDIRGYNCLTGIKIDPGATASFSPIIRDFYFTGTNGIAGPRVSTGIRLVGNCINPQVIHPIIEYCLYGIHATSILQVKVTGADIESNTRDYFGADASFDIDGEQSTLSTHAVTWSAFESYKRFLWKAGARWQAAGGASTDSVRTIAAINTWEALFLEDAMLSPYLNPNPGGASSDTIQVITPGLYQLAYQVTWATATAVAGFGGVRLRKGGVEIPGSFSDCYVPAVSGASAQCARTVIVECAANDLLTIQMNATDTQLRVGGRLSGLGAAPTSATGASWTVRHLGATSVATL